MDITEDYVSFEVAKLLKEKGFDEAIDLWYDENGDKFFAHHCNIRQDWRVRQNQKVYQCPTLQMACKWLREVHKLVITVSIGNENNKGNTDYSNPDRWFYFFDITNAKGVVIDTEYNPFSNEFSTYEEAVEAACLYVLKNLI